MTDIVYGSLNALVPVRRLLDEAGSALADRTRTLLSPSVPDIFGAAAGAGAAIITAGSASRTAGAAALTSGLAAAGSIVGGGMLAGIAVAAAPAVILAVGGFAVVTYWNGAKLERERRALLQEAIRKHEAILREQRAQNTRNRERADYLHAMVVKLDDVIRNLRGDLGERPT